jgi:hypothetical protein
MPFDFLPWAATSTINILKRSLHHVVHAGIPKETEVNESRVSLTPLGAAALIKAGFTVNVEARAGARAEFTV